MSSYWFYHLLNFFYRIGGFYNVIVLFFLYFFSEWIDFPRGDQRLPNGKIIAGNNNSFDKCRRRFDLVSLCLILKPNLTIAVYSWLKWSLKKCWS